MVGSINFGDFLSHQLPVKEVQMFLKLLTLKVDHLKFQVSFPHGLGKCDLGNSVNL